VGVGRLLLRGEAGTFCRNRRDDALSREVDHRWIRRQYAPSHDPPGDAAPAMREDRTRLEIGLLDARRPPSRRGGDCFARVP
jgi:hypothetical protein